ncbi:MAG: aquaporin family protein [SAR116 cluster bacterium]|nr:aquaporin family protein [SAR116 cluster bacterium]|tara:strand:+ start:1507 stop:2163 length:657 start_codon:yes stop_codon:yes gene_type:complete
MTYKKNMAEFIGTSFLLGTIVGSGIMSERLSAGIESLALLGNTVATGAILFVMITILAPVSGAHFNPVVSLVMRLRGNINNVELSTYLLTQIAGSVFGTWIAHFMFDISIIQFSSKIRTGSPIYIAEFVATFGLIFTILLGSRYSPKKVPALVGLYITGAYWFTSSTSFANPAVTFARTLTDTFSGINFSDLPFFILFQILGGVSALAVCNLIENGRK